MAGDVGVREKGGAGEGCAVKVGDGRTPDGRFAPGYAGGKGNPFASEVHRMRCDMFEALDSPRWKRTLEQLIDKAAEGDLAAIKVLLGFIGPALLAGIVETPQTAVAVTVMPSSNAEPIDRAAVREVLRLVRVA